MFNKKDKAEEEISEVAFEDLEPTELSAAQQDEESAEVKHRYTVGVPCFAARSKTSR